MDHKGIYEELKLLSLGTGYVLCQAESLRDGLRGDKLEAAVKAHAEKVAEHARTTRLKSLTPEKQHQFEMSELAREQDKQVAAINKAAEAIRERAVAGEFVEAERATGRHDQATREVGHDPDVRGPWLAGDEVRGERRDQFDDALGGQRLQGPGGR